LGIALSGGTPEIRPEFVAFGFEKFNASLATNEGGLAVVVGATAAAYRLVGGVLLSAGPLRTNFGAENEVFALNEVGGNGFGVALGIMVGFALLLATSELLLPSTGLGATGFRGAKEEYFGEGVVGVCLAVVVGICLAVVVTVGVGVIVVGFSAVFALVCCSHQDFKPVVVAVLSGVAFDLESDVSLFTKAP
jgi:hypothetical protein